MHFFHTAVEINIILPVHVFAGIHWALLYALVDKLVDVGVIHAPEICIEESLWALETTNVKVNTPGNQKMITVR